MWIVPPDYTFTDRDAATQKEIQAENEAGFMVRISLVNGIYQRSTWRWSEGGIFEETHDVDLKPAGKLNEFNLLYERDNLSETTEPRPAKGTKSSTSFIRSAAWLCAPNCLSCLYVYIYIMYIIRFYINIYVPCGSLRPRALGCSLDH